jgi:hypothetical protein
MNRGLYFYGIMLVTIATIVFSVNEFGVAHATTGIDLGNNPAQSNQVPDLKSDPNDNDDNNNDQSSSSSSTTSTSSGSSSSGQDDVPMALPFNSNVADESDDEKDYSSVIPFP